MRTTIKDVARECGVSTATVSLALSGKTGRVSESTRKKILEAVERMNYIPSSAASSLGKHRTRMVGILSTDIRMHHGANLFMAMIKALQERNYIPVCHILANRNRMQTEEIVNQFTAADVCAIYWGMPFNKYSPEENDRLYSRIGSLGIPVIAVKGYEFTNPGATVYYDFEKAGYIATKHLIDEGHRRIGMITGYPDFRVSVQRSAGYYRALSEAGIDPDPKLVYEGDFSLRSGAQALSYLMGQQVSAIFAHNDEMAIGASRAAKNYGLRIPDDLSVIGSNNIAYDDILETPLSTVAFPVDEMGAFIGEKLCEFADGNIPAEHELYYYEPSLYLRGSTAKKM